MFLDNLLTFDSATTTITSSVASTNVLDMSQARDMGIGDDKALKLQLNIGTAFVSGGGATLNIQFQGSTDSSTWTTYAESGVVAAASLTANSKQFAISVPHRPGGAALPRYYRLYYTVATSTFSAGTIGYAGLVLDRDDSPGYPSGFTVTN